MSREFTTRVELHGAGPTDYEALHRYMAEANFSRFVKGDDGVLYQLPTAEYTSSGFLAKEDVRTLAAKAAARTGKPFWVLVTEANGRAWTLNIVGKAA